jgi:hypothetical protein
LYVLVFNIEVNLLRSMPTSPSRLRYEEVPLPEKNSIGTKDNAKIGLGITNNSEEETKNTSEVEKSNTLFNQSPIRADISNDFSLVGSLLNDTMITSDLVNTTLEGIDYQSLLQETRVESVVEGRRGSILASLNKMDRIPEVPRKGTESEVVLESSQEFRMK